MSEQSAKGSVTGSEEPRWQRGEEDFQLQEVEVSGVADHRDGAEGGHFGRY